MSSPKTFTDAVEALHAFSHPEWNDELLNICLLVAEDDAQSNGSNYNIANVNNTAAAIVWAVVKTQFSDFAVRAYDIKLKDICQFYDVKTGTIRDRADRIMGRLQMNLKNPEFKTQKHLDFLEATYGNYEEQTSFGEEDKLRMLEEMIVVKMNFQIDQDINTASQMSIVNTTKRIERTLKKEFDDLEIKDIIIDMDNNELELIVSGTLISVGLVGERLLQEGFEFLNMQPLYEEDDDRSENHYAPNAHYVSLISMYISGPDLKASESAEELEELMKLKTNKTPEELQAEFPPGPKASAWLLSLDAYDQPEVESLATIEEALNMDPNCLEAHLCKVGWMSDPEKRIDALENLLDLGDKVLGADKDDFDPERWWYDIDTRPYMRAVMHLGEELINCGYYDEGLEVLMEAIEKNPTDNQGIRDMIMETAIIHRKLNYVSKMNKKYPEEEGIVFYYANALYAYYKYGNKSKSKRLAYNAFNRNEHPMLIFLGEEDPPTLTGYFKRFSKEEAIEVLPFLDNLYSKDKKAIHWLVKQFSEWKFG